MKIVISGIPGSGKSTLAKTISKKLKLKYISMGELQRKIAKEKGLSINELSKLEEEDDSFDRMIDKKQRDIGLSEDNFILDSRLGALFIPQADIKIFIDCDINTRVERILKDKRQDEKGTDEELKKKIIQRETSEEERFKRFYNFDYKNKDQYDIVLDSTHLDKQEVYDWIIGKIKKQA